VCLLYLGKNVIYHSGAVVKVTKGTPQVQALQDFPLPETTKELRCFLGMLNFYQRFIPKAAKMQAPIHDLLGAKKGATVIN